MENLSNMCICLHGSGARRPPYTHYFYHVLALVGDHGCLIWSDFRGLELVEILISVSYRRIKLWSMLAHKSGQKMRDARKNFVISPVLPPPPKLSGLISFTPPGACAIFCTY